MNGSNASATSTATLQGQVFDSTGGILPGVTVTLVDMNTNQSRMVASNAQGVYRFAGLTPGRYAVSGELQGFSKFVQSNITLNVGAAVDLDIRLQVSTVAETITVTGESPIIESAKTALTSVIAREQIDTLPTKLSRLCAADAGRCRRRAHGRTRDRTQVRGRPRQGRIAPGGRHLEH